MPHKTPYYNSIIVNKYTGFGITIFDWAVKKFSDDVVEDGLADKFFAVIEENTKKIAESFEV